MGTDWTEYGEVFTRRWVVDSILDLVGYDVSLDLADRVMVEPSIGSGAFLVPIVERLLESAKAHGRRAEDLTGALRGYDLLEASVERSKCALRPILLGHEIDAQVADKLLDTWLHTADFLLSDMDAGRVDFVVGNPPYIRLEEIPERITSAYRAAWPTMRGRADIYVGFFERGLTMLRDGGKLGFICADRWMRNQYGGALRELVGGAYSVDAVWTMHQADAFEAEVDAYPAITILSRRSQGSAVVADTSAEFGEAAAHELAQWTLGDGASVEQTSFAAFRLEGWFGRGEKWVSGRPSLIALMEHLNEHFQPLQDPVTKTRVSIGVATGADKTYIVKTADVEPDRLLPLSMVGDLTSGQFIWGGNYLVNPWDDSGALVDLDEYPRLRSHFLANPKLVERHTARKQPLAWYRTIDKVNRSILDRPKLLIQDMRASINPVLESGGKYPHHNLYYVVSDVWDMEVLGGLLLSRIGQAFIEAYGVRMRGGTLRFQAQYLKLIRVPRPADISIETAERLRSAFRSRDVEAATVAAGDAYCIDLLEYELADRELINAK